MTACRVSFLVSFPRAAESWSCARMKRGSGDRGDDATLPAETSSSSPLDRSWPLAMTIPSPYQINEMLLSALPEDQRRHVQGRVMRARRYEPADRRSFQADPEEFQLSVGFAQAAETRVVESFTRRSMAMTVVEPSIGTYVVGLRTRGSVAISDRSSSNERMWGADSEIIYRERQDTRVVISDAHVGTSFELPNDRTNTILASMIERPVTVPIDLRRHFPLRRIQGRTLREPLHLSGRNWPFKARCHSETPAARRSKTS